MPGLFHDHLPHPPEAEAVSRHYTVLVEVKETVDPAPIEDSKGFAVKGMNSVPLLSDRKVIDRLRVVVSAEDENEAVQRAIDMLSAARA